MLIFRAVKAHYGPQDQISFYLINWGTFGTLQARLLIRYLTTVVIAAKGLNLLEEFILLMTWTLCSMNDPRAALREMRRVLKPEGKLLFVEHGLSPEPGIERCQPRLIPIWCHVAGGCHLDRKMDDLIYSSGVVLTKLRTEYANGPRPMTYTYVGRASRHRKPPEAAA